MNAAAYNNLIYIREKYRKEKFNLNVCNERFQSCKYSVAKFLLTRPRLALYSTMTIFTVTILSIFMFYTGPVLNARAEHVNTKYFTTIEVKSGDTLWDIAQEYRTAEYSGMEAYIDEVREINHIIGDEITSGCYLTIPYYAEEPMSN